MTPAAGPLSPPGSAISHLGSGLVAAVVAAGSLWPIYAIYRVLLPPPEGAGSLILSAAICFAFFFLLRWDLVPYPVRYVSAAAALVLAAAGGGPAGLATCAVGLAIVSWLLALRPGPASLDLAFPLRGGVFTVVSGGRWPVTNSHFRASAQRYALDITRLNRCWVRATGIYPARHPAYAVFGATVYSPCDAWVEEAVDGFADLPVGTRDPLMAGGNHILLRVRYASGGDALLKLSHLQRGSIRVRPGQAVRGGEPLAAVGNSGNTSEPHLHIHAQTAGGPAGPGGDPVPLLFRGRWLIRNSLVRSRAVVAAERWYTQFAFWCLGWSRKGLKREAG